MAKFDTNMNAIEKTFQFQKQFGDLVHSAVDSGIALPNIIMTLGDAEFELRMLLFRVRQEQTAKELTSKIIPANGTIKLPPMR